MKSSIYDCKVLSLNKTIDKKEHLTSVSTNPVVPFKIKRVYYMYDIPGGENRGGHMHKELFQFIIASSGSFDVLLDDGQQKKLVTLKSPDQGLFIVPGIWRELFEFSSGAVCLVLASEVYNQQDYIKEYAEFLNYKKNE